MKFTFVKSMTSRSTKLWYLYLLQITRIFFSELTNGIAVYDENGELIGNSKRAAIKAVGQVVASRIGMAAPGMCKFGVLFPLLCINLCKLTYVFSLSCCSTYDVFYLVQSMPGDTCDRTCTCPHTWKICSTLMITLA